ncbi:MAG TPA: glycosyltransferase family 1 protein [Verrucomicrobiae bacterium]|nr:glycosyltransferase family 1 protein [Verrucomicrobiae bacterium]
MKIGLFALETGRNVGGLEVYETELIRALARVDAVNDYRIFCLNQRVPEILDLHAPNFQFVVHPVHRVKGVLWDAPRAMARARLDLFHALFVPPPFTSIPYVFTHHGSEVLERPDFYPSALGLRMRVLFRRAFARAGRIVCVSDYLRRYLTEQRGLPANRLHTIYHGCRPEFRPRDPATARASVACQYGVHVPFILSVGRIEPRKNPVRVLRAYDRFRQQVPHPPRMVFAGDKNWGGPEFDRTVTELGVGRFLHQLGHVSHADLPQLYAAAEFVVFASLWEGFGLPALEAMAAGAPLITSNTTSLPEIVGHAAQLVDPESVESIAAARASLHTDPVLRSALSCRGRARAEEFSWDRTARETIQVYTALHAQTSRSAVANR